MRIAVIGTALLLGACSGGNPPVAVENGTTAPTGGITSVVPGVATGSTDCSTRPDFAAVYPGATILTCSSAHFDDTGKDAGSTAYKTDATPAEVLAWFKDATAKAGLTPAISTDRMFSARDGMKRTTVTHITAEGSGTRAVVNWSKTP